MIYDKLPALMLSVLASEKSGSTNSVIAGFILNHPEQASEMGINELADACHAGTGSGSRFCRDYGFQDFSVLLQADFSVTSAGLIRIIPSGATGPELKQVLRYAEYLLQRKRKNSSLPVGERLPANQTGGHRMD